jgi:hypothetical protein
MDWMVSFVFFFGYDKVIYFKWASSLSDHCGWVLRDDSDWPGSSFSCPMVLKSKKIN